MTVQSHVGCDAIAVADSAHHQRSRSVSKATANKAIEIIPIPIGDFWRVRIQDGERLQFVSGFAKRSEAEEWIKRGAARWLAGLQHSATRL